MENWISEEIWEMVFESEIELIIITDKVQTWSNVKIPGINLFDLPFRENSSSVSQKKHRNLFLN